MKRTLDDATKEDIFKHDQILVCAIDQLADDMAVKHVSTVTHATISMATIHRSVSHMH